MTTLSRRQLAIYAVDELLSGAVISHVARTLAAELIESKRTDQIDMLISDIAYLLETRGEAADVTVTSVSILNDDSRNELVTTLKGLLNVKDINLHEIQDSSLIGGLTIESATKRWDASLKRTLNDLRKELVK